MAERARGRAIQEPAGARPPFGVPNYQRVRDAIRSDIARGVLAPDARLKLGELTARYGLSTAPIREALSQLAAEGWVIIHPNRGAQVREIDDGFIRELNEIRSALDSYLVNRCAMVATPQQVDALDAIEVEYERAVERFRAPRGAGVAALLAINARLHQAIRAIHPNREAAALIDRHSQFFGLMRAVWGYGDYRPQQIASEHRALLAAIRRHDGAEAERLSRRHIENAMEDLLQLRRQPARGRPEAP